MNAETGLGNCFHGSCDMGTFNKWSFIKAYLGNPSNADVVNYIKQIVATMGWRPKRKAKVVTPSFVEEVNLPSECVKLPDANGSNLDYLERRGITAKLAKHFSLYFCVNGSFSYQSPIGEREQQYYGNRVVVPIFDLHGRMTTFQGRDITGESARKYLFPPGLPSSGKLLYGGHLVKGKAELVVTEGVFDAITCAGVFESSTDLKDVGSVATFGMHLSDNSSEDDQVSYFVKLKRLGLKRVTFMWDSEKKAIHNAYIAAKRLSSLGLIARVAILPKGKDPNDSSSDELIHAYYSAHNIESPKGRKEVLRKIM